MLLKNYIFLLFFFYGCCLFAQRDSVYYGDKNGDKKPVVKKRNDAWKEKVFYGGNFSGWISNPIYINLGPLIGYKITDKLHAGIGVIYNYSSVRFSNGRVFTQSIYGGHSFARVFINESIFLQGQFDRLNQPNYNSANWNNERIWIDYTLVGGGYRSRVGNRGAFIACILYNVSPHALSVYSNPYLQMGFIGGF